MSKPNDVRGIPGDIVLIRGGRPIDVWDRPGGYGGVPSVAVARVGVVDPKASGLIIAVHERAWTYVLWSTPCIMGWVPDGILRKVKLDERL